jgi:predicted esterase
MDNQIHYLKVEKTARVVTSGDIKSAGNIWLVAHGYGQLSTYFIQKLNALDEKEHFVIVPEGLHRYYLNGFSGRVGASWMTKEDREKDIDDYCNYLDTVYEHFIQKAPGTKTINALGFSQGGATISRWAANTKHVLDNLIIWGSVIPPDMNWEKDLKNLIRFHWIYVAGSQDEFLSPGQQKKQLQLLEKYGIRPDTVFYEGKHDIQENALHLLTQKCVKKNS